MYTRKKYNLGKFIEFEYHYKGNYGAKGEKRADRKSVTSEQIERQNQWNRERKYKRLIMRNFRQGDLWTTFKYPAGIRPAVEDVKNDFAKFRNCVRREYRKVEMEFKYIYRMEIGARGGIHVHMLLNRLWNAGIQTDTLLEREWSKILRKRLGEETRTQGLVDYKSAYEAGGFKDLAEYLCKKPKKDSQIEGQLSLFDEPERKKLLAVQCSRNLERPVPEEKTYSHWTMKKIIECGPEPTPGYYIDQDSVICGVNPVTGLSYLYYTEVMIEDARRKEVMIE